MQRCPAQPVNDLTTPSTVTSGSASGTTIRWFFAPPRHSARLPCAAAHGKRALCLGGAKNHLIVVPDADPEVTVDGVVKSFTGCAGQRCMAASLLVAVGDVDPLIDQIVERTRKVALGTE